jgi:membrane-anchored protein YejM (alkaline phosphatase superfamily)
VILAAQQITARGTQSVEDDFRLRATDVSAQLILDALTPAAAADGDLYAYLQRNTNIARDVEVKPVNVDLAPLSGASPWRPHIFVFVVDSLRRDYLSPYNNRVDFTPGIARFAADSTTFQRAFTRYGATGLSVPSIWTGGMLLHKQYVTPFRPMNALLKLVEAERYQQWLSLDPILEAIAPSNIRGEPLDAASSVKDHRLCGTLENLRGRLDRLAAAGEPAFVYSLSQDIHVSAIAREGSRPIDDRPYGTFNAAYASRIRRFDDCFGRFIDDLKTRGLFEDSLIVLTADHGDSLGEEGRMGHAYTIFPEILQVPLIVHLPARQRGELNADPRAVAFTSDVTPTIYRLLGHEPARPASFFGQPLYHRRSTAPGARPQVEVVASSYGSVYGALLDDARRLYIIDGVSFREHEYELDGTGAGHALEVRAADRAAAQAAIRATVGDIARFFKYPQGTDR